MKKLFSHTQEKHICNQYKNGLSQVEISKIYNCSNATISNLLKRNAVKIRSRENNRRQININVDYFENIDSHEKAYILGYMIADGNIGKNLNAIKFTCKKEDMEILEKLKEELGSEHKISIQKYGKNSFKPDAEKAVFVFSSKKMKEDLNNLGIFPNKTKTVCVPKIDDVFVNSLILGIFDGDGCFYIDERRAKRVELSITCNNFVCDYIKSIFEEKFNAKVGEQRRMGSSSKVKSIRISSYVSVLRIMNWLYKDSSIFLKRKREKYEYFLKYIINRAGFDKKTYNKCLKLGFLNKKILIKERLNER